ncbi:hypothetical protein LWC33_07705 [Pseudonocardia sp. RS11V-5]|uniref:hypothetical protein n=1 Tax=Pseudonocardia terrae TaxID=2905831 RepID=UPI001E5118EA|nr:hypothetical protein [Pseudonocardia terrae]MCE3551336.1 hypothetical protein [Pseudonocardia terrae]
MNSFLLIWDSSDKSYNPDDYASDIAASSREERISTWWSFGSRRRGAEKGDRVYLLRQYNDRGIVASGYLESGNITERPHWDDPRKTIHTVDVSWDSVMPSRRPARHRRLGRSGTGPQLEQRLRGWATPRAGNGSEARGRLARPP